MGRVQAAGSHAVRTRSKNAGSQAALEVQVQRECRHLGALRVRVQTLRPALGLSEECALALLVLWIATYLASIFHLPCVPAADSSRFRHAALVLPPYSSHHHVWLSCPTGWRERGQQDVMTLSHMLYGLGPVQHYAQSNYSVNGAVTSDAGRL